MLLTAEHLTTLQDALRARLLELPTGAELDTLLPSIEQPYGGWTVAFATRADGFRYLTVAKRLVVDFPAEYVDLLTGETNFIPTIHRVMAQQASCIGELRANCAESYIAAILAGVEETVEEGLSTYAGVGWFQLATGAIQKATGQGDYILFEPA